MRSLNVATKEYWQNYIEGNLDAWKVTSCKITLQDRREITIDEEHVSLSNCHIATDNNSSFVLLGGVCIDNVQLEIYNGDYKYRYYSFFGFHITELKISATFGESTVTLDLGQYYCTEAKQANGFITLNGSATPIDLANYKVGWGHILGNIFDYKDLSGVVTSIRNVTGLSAGSNNLVNTGYAYRRFNINEPDMGSITKLIGEVASIGCAYAYIRSNYLNFYRYETKLSTIHTLRARHKDGSILDQFDEQYYVLGDDLDGNTATYDCGSFTSEASCSLDGINYIPSNVIGNLETQTDPIQYDGAEVECRFVKTQGSASSGGEFQEATSYEWTYSVSSGYSSNKITLGKPSLLQMLLYAGTGPDTSDANKAKTAAQAIINSVKSKYADKTISTFKADIMFNPLLETGDLVCLQDMYGTVTFSIINKITHNFSGYTTIECAA